METTTDIRITVIKKSLTVKHSLQTGITSRKETRSTSYITSKESKEMKKKPSRQGGANPSGRKL